MTTDPTYEEKIISFAQWIASTETKTYVLFTRLGEDRLTYDEIPAELRSSVRNMEKGRWIAKDEEGKYFVTDAGKAHVIASKKC